MAKSKSKPDRLYGSSLFESKVLSLAEKGEGGKKKSESFDHNKMYTHLDIESVGALQNPDGVLGVT